MPPEEEPSSQNRPNTVSAGHVQELENRLEGSRYQKSSPIRRLGRHSSGGSRLRGDARRGA